MYQVAVVEDDPVQLDDIAKMVKALLREYQCRVHCFSGMKQVDFSEEVIPQVAVLDIELGEKENGVDVARRLQQRSPGCQIIFLTNYAKYISEVYEVPHLYLVLKSDVRQYLPKALNMAMEHLTREEENVFWLKHGTTKKCLLQRDIIVFERCQRATFVYTGQSIFRTVKSLGEIEPLMESERFVRCHQSFLVKMDCVAQHAIDNFVLINGKTVPISRQFQQAVRNKFLQHIAECVQI